MTNLGGRGRREHVSQHFSPGGPVASPNFYMKQSQSSVIKFSYFYQLKSVITNLGWMKGINPQIIWLHSSNDLEILLIVLLSPPPNFCMTQSQFFVIKFNSFIILLPEVSDSKTLGGEHDRSPNIYTRGTLKLLSPIFHDTSQSSDIKFNSFIFSTT